ncbi:telomerase reverse transcriptase isoform X2 [Augochlora pura]
MNYDTLYSIKEYYGQDFQRYLLRENITLHKDKCGAFKVPSLDQLRQCLCKIHTNELILKRNMRKCTKGFRIKSKEDERNISYTKSINPFLTNLRLCIQLKNSCANAPTCAFNAVSKDYILNTAITGDDIYEYIIKKTMTRVNIIDYESSIPMITNFLSQFQRNHKKFDYIEILKTLIGESLLSKNSKYEYKVPVEQVISFYEIIFSNVVPMAMFGNFKNLRKIKKGLKYLLIISPSKIYNLVFLIEKLNISSITWLKDVQSQETQWLLLAKFIRWFFVGYLIKILHTCFHVASISSNNNERIYIARTNWFSIQKKFIIKKLRSNGLHPAVPCNECNSKIGIYKLWPKPSSVRPILASKLENNEKRQLILISKFLKQLKITEYGFTNFEEIWKSIIRRRHDLGMHEKLYIVACDVKDAFGSIIQGILYDIILSLCRKLPENLLLSIYAIKGTNCRVNDDILRYKEYFSNENLQLPLIPGTLYAEAVYGPTREITKNCLLEKIWQCISNERVKIGNETYIISKGVTQGAMLSPILSDLYYSYMLQKEMSSFYNYGKIIKYVDDILYVTNNEIQARRFLQLVRKGIPSYNCYFNESKIQTNIKVTNRVTNSINYIGYKINCDTLEVAPSYLSRHVRSVISYNSKNAQDPLMFFEKQLCQISRLKLSKFVLDKSINFQTNLNKIFKKAFSLQAEFISDFISEIFHSDIYNAKNVIKAIKHTSFKITKNIIKNCVKNEKMNAKEITKMSHELINLMWSCYKHTFKKNKDLKQYFIRLPLKKKRKYVFLRSGLLKEVLKIANIGMENIIENEIISYKYKIESIIQNLIFLRNGGSDKYYVRYCSDYIVFVF